MLFINVVGAPQIDASSERVDNNYRYVLTPDKSEMFTNVVNVGNHDYDDPTTGSGPIPDAEANSALAFYLKEGTTLCISGDSKTSGLSAGAMLVNTAGDGDVILRAPGYKNDGAAAWDCVVEGKTQAKGGLYLAPKIMNSDSIVDEQNMNFVLGKNADISSFRSVNIGTQHVEMVVSDKLGKNEQGHHINNLTLLGCSSFDLHINTDKNEELVFGGTTTVQTYVYFGAPGGNGHTGATLNMNFNQSATATIEHLESNREYDYNYYWRYERLYLWTAYGDKYDSADTIDAVVNIDSFDYRGYITYTAHTAGSIHVNLTLQDGQWLESSQYTSFDMKSESSASLMLKGIGRYVLEEGTDIRINFGRLSEEKSGEDYLWRGTVQLTNLDATSSGTGNGIDFAVHGNAQSVVDMNGFKGDVVEWGEDGTASANQPESIIIAPHLQLTNTDDMRAFEVTGGVASQTYAGGISGSGDFVVSSSGAHSITFSGDVSGWEGALEVTQGTHTVTMSKDATTVNASIAASGSGTLGLITAADVTYNSGVQVSSLAVNSGKSATLTQGATAGNVSIAGNGGGHAVLSGGTTNAMQVANGMVSGGKAANAAITFNTAAAANVLNTISDIELQNVKLSSTVANDTILLQGIRTGWTPGASVVNNDVELVGSGVTFRSVLGEGEQFAYQSTQAAALVNHVALQTDAFAGTKLGSGAAVEVQVADAVNWGDLVNDLQTNVTIHLQGLYVDGMTIGEKIQASAMPDYVKISVNGAAARSSMPGVADLLAQEFDSITYLQQADGFMISMTHAIPEPTTATLSLLALAALAARRRR